MKIVLDLQGAQSESRFRGIGRYSLGLAEAFVKLRNWLSLGDAVPELYRSEVAHLAAKLRPALGCDVESSLVPFVAERGRNKVI